MNQVFFLHLPSLCYVQSLDLSARKLEGTRPDDFI